MTNKYIDLAERIWRTDNGRTSYASVGMVLEWLDEHPDQAPGRTITERRYRALTDSDPEEYGSGFSDGFFFAGGCIVPDPEPTNRDRLQGWLVEFAERNASCGGERGDCDLAEFLDAHGVKAPGGDDD